MKGQKIESDYELLIQSESLDIYLNTNIDEITTKELISKSFKRGLDKGLEVTKNYINELNIKDII